MDDRQQTLYRRLAEADGYSPTGQSRRARKKNGRLPRKLRKQARALAQGIACNPPGTHQGELAAMLPVKPRRGPIKGDPLARQISAMAPELAQLLVDNWPGVNVNGMPDGGYAMTRGVVAEVFYAELATAYRMRVVPVDYGADEGMRAGCDAVRQRIRELPFAEVTPEHFGCVHEVLAGHHLEAGRVVPNDGRRRTGTHYTPPELAMKVTSRTLEPLLKCIGEQSPMVLRVCDPSVGAGAFLLAVMRMLAPILCDRGEASSLAEAKRLVAIHCCYGVDKARYAVHSCQLAMTLEARADRMPRDWLDDNIKHGDALVGLSQEQISAFHWKKGAAPQSWLSHLIKRAMDEGARARHARIATLSEAARGAA